SLFWYDIIIYKCYGGTIMNKEVRDTLYTQAKEWVLEAGVRVRKQMLDPLVIHTKSSPRDLVTTVDQETERFFAMRIREQYPDHHLISEEGYGDRLHTTEGVVWIIDPIDGTTNFIHQRRNFAISLAIYVDGIGEIAFVYDIMQDYLYHAKRNEGAYKNHIRLKPLRRNFTVSESVLAMNNRWLIPNTLVDESVMEQLIQEVRGTRTYGSAALEFCYVAEGIVDGYLSHSLCPWDIAAGMILVREVGGITTNIDGDPVDILKKNSILTCNPSIQESIIKDYIEKGRKA